MPCNDILGDWIRGILADDSSEDAMIDPPLNISNATGTFRGRFQVTGESDFNIVCNDTGPRVRVEFTRIHQDGTTTDYNGKVVPFGQRAVVGIIKGRFRRVTTLPSGRLAVTTGDWETERPT